MKDISIYSMGDVQITCLLSSDALIWKSIALKITIQGNFHHIQFK